MSEKRFTLRAAAYLLRIKIGKILPSRRFNTSWRNGDYSLLELPKNLVPNVQQASGAYKTGNYYSEFDVV